MYEHIIINKYTDKETDREPRFYLNKSLDVYKNVSKVAAQNGVQLLVFPEDGLFVPEDRIDAMNYVEQIPEVNKDNLVTPCTDPRFGANSPGILRTLSCTARDSNLYIVADIGDRVPCHNPESNSVYKNSIGLEANQKRAVDDGRCPEDGHFLYNTAVAFDPNGQLVLRYHKKHLFGEFQYDVPAEQEHAILKTPFGSFGVYICFDKIFKDPPITLIESFNQTNLILTTWWFDEMPFLMAPQIHSSFAETNGINYIVSNIKRLKVASTGSGIYSGNKIVTYHHDTKNDGRPVLLVADVPQTPGQVEDCDANTQKTIYFDFMIDSDYRTTQVNLSAFDYVIIPPSNVMNQKICNGSLCCSVSGQINGAGVDEYFLGVSNRIRSSYLHTGKFFSSGTKFVPLEKKAKVCAILYKKNNGANFGTDYKTFYKKDQTLCHQLI